MHKHHQKFNGVRIIKTLSNVRKQMEIRLANIFEHHISSSLKKKGQLFQKYVKQYLHEIQCTGKYYRHVDNVQITNDCVFQHPAQLTPTTIKNLTFFMTIS